MLKSHYPKFPEYWFQNTRKFHHWSAQQIVQTVVGLLNWEKWFHNHAALSGWQQRRHSQKPKSTPTVFRSRSSSAIDLQQLLNNNDSLGRSQFYSQPSTANSCTAFSRYFVDKCSLNCRAHFCHRKWHFNDALVLISERGHECIMYRSIGRPVISCLVV